MVPVDKSLKLDKKADGTFFRNFLPPLIFETQNDFLSLHFISVSSAVTSLHLASFPDPTLQPDYDFRSQIHAFSTINICSFCTPHFFHPSNKAFQLRQNFSFVDSARTQFNYWSNPITLHVVQNRNSLSVFCIMDVTHVATPSSTTRPVIPNQFTSLSCLSAFSKYDFRPTARESAKKTWVTWLDQDESGNYDPDGCRSPQPPVIKRKRPAPADGIHVQKPKKAKASLWQQRRYTGLSYPILFKFVSSHGRALLKGIGTSSDHWPEDQSETNDSERDCFWSGSADSSATDQTCDLSAPYNLRDRLGSTCSTVEQHGNGISSLEEISLGHPAARGCKACFKLGLPCELLLEGSKYPCRACAEDGEECELIIQPLQKRACEGCRRRRIVCSYREESDHSLPCVQCTGSNMKCVAGPRSGRTRNGPSLDQDFSQPSMALSLPQRTVISCTECRRNHKWCSLRSKKQKIPCNQCRESKVDCTLAPLPCLAANGNPETKGHNVLQTRLQGQEVKDQETQCTQERPQTEHNSNAVMAETKFITTQLTHPVTFNYVPLNGSSSLPCHWCDDMIYGLLGLGAVRVEVIDNQDGQGYIEVAGGHAAECHLPSRMCSSCTLERLMIAACGSHDMQPLPGMDLASFDFGSVTDHMTPGTAASAPFAWCSVCPSPAFYACRRKPPLCNDDDDDESEAGHVLGNVHGCGLRLCAGCTAKLADDHDGVLDRLIAQLKLDAGGAEFLIRADAEFLLLDEELLRKMSLEIGRR